MGAQIDLILTSPYLRAADTAFRLEVQRKTQVYPKSGAFCAVLHNYPLYNDDNERAEALASRTAVSAGGGFVGFTAAGI